MFSKDHYAGRYIKPHIQSTTFGPYTEPVMLKVTRQIDMINDLLVVGMGTTTQLINDNQLTDYNIVYISPHKASLSVGNAHTSTGVNLDGDFTITTGQDLDAGISPNVPLVRITSKDYKIKADTILSSHPSTNEYVHVSETTHNDAGEPFSENFPVSESLAKVHFTKHSAQMDNDHWDGVIPAGYFFTIQTWGTSDKYAGWDGEISVIPVNESSSVNIKGECSVVGKGKTYKEAKADAGKKSKRLMYKKINNQLMREGFRKKSSGTYSWELLIEKSAQNTYDKGFLQLEKNPALNVGVNFDNQDFVYYEGMNQKTPDKKTSSSPKASAPDESTSSTSSTSSSSSTSMGGY